MKLAQAVEIYVNHKRLTGAKFSKSSKGLRSFAYHAGNISMSEVQQSHVTAFLDGPLTSTVTWRSKYGLLKHFFLYWVARDEVPAAPLPVPRSPAIKRSFLISILGLSFTAFSRRVESLRRVALARSTRKRFAPYWSSSTQQELSRAKVANFSGKTLI